MGSTLDETTGSEHTCRHMTTLLLEERRDDRWVVTQGGVDVEGAGPTPAAAAADYCRQIENAEE